MERKDNYAVQSAIARQLFLNYDQDALIRKLNLQADDAWLYTKFFDSDYRVNRKNGDLERAGEVGWQEANSFHEVLTLLDLLCDSRENRFLTGKWKNMTDFGHQFHRSLAERRDPFAEEIQNHPDYFCAACASMGGKRLKGADLAWEIPVFQELSIALFFWEGDEEFAPRLRFLWDENALMYIKYETMYYAVAFLEEELLRRMGKQ